MDDSVDESSDVPLQANSVIVVPEQDTSISVIPNHIECPETRRKKKKNI